MNYDKVYRNGIIKLFINCSRKPKNYLAQIKGFEEQYLFKRDFLPIELYGDGDYGWMLLNSDKCIYEYQETHNERVYFMYGEDSLVLITKQDVINLLNKKITFLELKFESDIYQKNLGDNNE